MQSNTEEVWFIDQWCIDWILFSVYVTLQHTLFIFLLRWNMKKSPSEPSSWKQLKGCQNISEENQKQISMVREKWFEGCSSIHITASILVYQLLTKIIIFLLKIPERSKIFRTTLVLVRGRQCYKHFYSIVVYRSRFCHIFWIICVTSSLLCLTQHLIVRK